MPHVQTAVNIGRISGFPGKAALNDGVLSRGWINGFIDAPGTTFAHLHAELDPHVLAPERFMSRIPRHYGHYALAVETRNADCVYLIADAFGSHPIYYAETRLGWVWSFDYKSIAAVTEDVTIDPHGLAEFCRYSWLMEENTPLSAIKQVLPSHCVCLRPGQAPLISRYTRVSFVPGEQIMDESALIVRTDDALDAYFSRLRRRTSRIAVFFSGGVDSTLLLAKAREHGFDRLLAVTAGFAGHDNPEAERATAVARYLNAEHRIVDVPDAFIAAFMEQLVVQSERPPTYMNTFARAKMFQDIAGEVDVVLTGEAADCMFSNDRSYGAARYDHRARMVQAIPSQIRSWGCRALAPFHSNASQRLQYLLQHDTLDYLRDGDAYDNLLSAHQLRVQDAVPSLRTTVGRSHPYYDFSEPESFTSLTAFCQNRGLHTQNRNQYYCYSSLARHVGLSVEMPFLCREIADIALTLPDSLKSDALGPKPILKKLATGYVPAEWIYASKMGFETPHLDWMQGPLAPWRRVLTDDRTRARGLFDPDVMQQLDPVRDRILMWKAMGIELFLRQFADGDAY